MSNGRLRVLITNVETPLGAALLQALLCDPSLELAVAWSSQPTPRAGASDPRLRAFQLDLRHDRELWRALFVAAREHQINCVIHDPISLVTAHRPALDWAQAAVQSRRLLLHCREHPDIRHFVLRSSVEVYRVASDLPSLIDEEHPLDFANRSRRVRSLVEIDAYASSRAIEAGPQLTVLRTAELLAKGVGSELFDYLCAPVCLRPLGYDPMLNVISIADAARALATAATSTARSVFNAPGKDVLPLSRLIALAGRPVLPLPGGLLTPLYRWRARAKGSEFYYPGYADRFHLGTMPDGRRIARELGFQPTHGIDFEQLTQEIHLTLSATRLRPG